MCDECVITIAAKEKLDLPNKYQCEICKKYLKQRHNSSCITIAILNPWHLYVKFAKSYGEKMTHLNSICSKSITTIFVFVAMKVLREKKN